MSRTAARTIDVLEHVSALPEPAGLLEIAAATGLDKSTAARLLAFLGERGLVARDPDTRRYAPGSALVALGAAVLQRSSLRSIARPRLEALRDLTGETATLHLLVDGRIVCIDGAESRHPIRRAVPMGEALALGEGVTGKVIAALLPAEEIAAAVPARGLRDMGPMLAAARADGWLAAVGDRIPGVRAAAAPVVVGGRPRAALTVAGPAERWEPARMEAHAPALLDAVHSVAGTLEATMAGA